MNRAHACTAGAFALAAAYYLFAGAGIGQGALDSDTLAMVVAWRTLIRGVVVESWQMAVPKLLPSALDGSLYLWLGLDAVVARAIFTAAALIAAASAFGGRAHGLPAGLIAGLFLLADRTTLALTSGGNSAVLFALCLVLGGHALLEWPRKRFAGMAFGALAIGALARQEGLLFLGLAVAAAAWGRWREGWRRAAAVALAGAALGAAVAIADDAFVSRLTGSDQTSRSILLANMKVFAAAGQAADGAGGEQRMGAVPALLARLLRPWPLYLILCSLGLAGLWRRSARAALITGAMFCLPVLYCWALRVAGIAVFDRYLYPSLIAAHLLAAVAYVFLWNALSRRVGGPAAFAARAALVLAAAGAWGVAARDSYFLRDGYLLREAAARREFREALSRIPDRLGTEGRILVSARYHAYAALSLGVEADRIAHDETVYAATDAGPSVAPFDYLLLERDSLLFRVLPAIECRGPACTLQSAGQTFEMAGSNPGSRFLLLAKRDSL